MVSVSQNDLKEGLGGKRRHRSVGGPTNHHRVRRNSHAKYI